MLSTIIPYYRKCFNPNHALYVEVKNNRRYYIYISLEYTIKEKVTKKQSPVFAPGKSERLAFPSGALFVYLKVFNCSQVPPTVICQRYIKNYVSTCYVVGSNSAGNLACVEVPCGNTFLN